jgi:uncharacterized YigZ family protein
MVEVRESYVSLQGQGRSETTVERSRFLGFARPVESVDEAVAWVESIRGEHYDARHVCFGFRIGHGAQLVDRSNDDGEPARTGGFPLWQLLDGADATNAIIVVVRYYGGVKLGTGGLARAYRQAGREALDDAGLVTIHPEHTCTLEVPYALIDTLEYRMQSMRGLRVVSKAYGANVSLELAVEYPFLADVAAELGEILQADLRATFDASSSNDVSHE